MLGLGQKLLDIFLIEDNDADIRWVEEILRGGDWPYEMNIAYDGAQALVMLKDELQYNEQSRPNLILLDLNIPKKHGLEVLREIKADIRLKNIPCAVLTSSVIMADMEEAFRLQACGYLLKPLDEHGLRRVIESIPLS